MNEKITRASFVKLNLLAKFLDQKMKSLKSILTLITYLSLSHLSAQNLTIYRSEISVDSTVIKIVNAVKSKDLVYFETVSHDAIAKQRGIEMAPTRMILFEDPDLMIKLIQCRQTTALDLPMKILVWEESEDVYIGFFDPKVMKKRFLLQDCEDVITEMSKLKIRLIAEVLRD